MQDNKETAEDLKDSLLSQEAANPCPEASPDDIDLRFDGLNKLHFWAYGVGHFVNDLVAAVWFNYLFYYLKKVVITEAASAALLAGQIADGLATPAVGLLSDKTKTRFGQRKPWYVLGLVMVVICYIPIYSGFQSTKGAEYAWYTIFPGLFNVGWASLQISHMSLVPSLTCSRKRRDKLNNLRNSFTFISNLTVLGLGLIIFSVMQNKFLEYRLIAYTVLLIGTIAAIFFICKINENELTEVCHDRQHHLREVVRQQKQNDKKALLGCSEVSMGSDSQDDDAIKPIKGVKKKQSHFDWFKMPKFYLFGVCYMSVRMYTNLFGTLLPFYLIDVVGMGTNNPDKISYNIALIPMLAYLSSVLMSFRLNWFYNNVGRKKALFIGTAICLVCLSSMAFLKPKHNWLMYPLSLFIGVSQTLVLATGINLISDVVGANAKSGAFVFGIYSLLDKFSCGIVIFLIGNSVAYSKNDNDPITSSDVSFIRWTMVLIPGISCLLSSLIVLSYPIQEYKESKKDSLGLVKKKSKLQEQLVA